MRLRLFWCFTAFLAACVTVALIARCFAPALGAVFGLGLGLIICCLVFVYVVLHYVLPLHPNDYPDAQLPRN